MGKIWLTSDQHYDHKNIIEYCHRPFGSVDHMREVLIANHNDCVGVNDTVYHIGDFSLKPATVEKVLPRLNGTHVLVFGNHDRVERAAAYSGFLEVLDSTELWGGFQLMHNPADAHPDSKRPVFHGHVHNSWKTRGRFLNVGVDVWAYKPVSLAEASKALWASMEAPGADLGPVEGVYANEHRQGRSENGKTKK